MPRPALSLLLLLTALPATAQQVYRCVSSDGTAVFADRPCHTVDAAPVAPPQPNSVEEPSEPLAEIGAAPGATTENESETGSGKKP